MVPNRPEQTKFEQPYRVKAGIGAVVGPDN